MPAHTLARNKWHQRSRGGRCLSFHILSSTESAVNTARDVLNSAPCLQEAADARQLMQDEGWRDCPSWREACDGARPPHHEADPGSRPSGWQQHASRIRNTHHREGELLPALCPASRALLRSQSGTHAGAWLTITPCEPAMTLEPQAVQLALRRRLRLPLPLCPIRCGPGPGCGQRVDPLGDHALACPRTGLLARRAKTVERA